MCVTLRVQVERCRAKCEEEKGDQRLCVHVCVRSVCVRV